LSKKGEDDAQIVNFESLELDEGDDSSSQKLTELLAYLKENLEPDKYTEVLTKLGVGQDMSNAQLLEAITKLVKKPEEEEDEYPEKKKAAEEEEKGPDRQAFMKECMAGGKTLEECTEEWKKKYPEPAKEEGDELKVPEEFRNMVKTLEDRIAELEGQKELAAVSMDVEKLVSEKHLAPVQREAVIKLSAKMSPENREELHSLFRTTQKFSAHIDVGQTTSLKPGEVAGNDLTLERKKELIRLHGLDGLIQDKADQTRLPWKERNN